MPTRLCALDDLIDGGAAKFEVEDRVLAVVRLGDDVYAIGDTCSHGDFSLSEGVVDEDECTLECPKHGSAFSLTTGDALTLPAVRGVPRYDISVVDGQVEVTLS